MKQVSQILDEADQSSFWFRSLNDKEKRLWFWWCIHRWSIIKLRCRFVFAAVALGVLAALIIIATNSPLYSSTATVRVEGLDSEGYITNGFLPDEIPLLHHQRRPKPGEMTW